MQLYVVWLKAGAARVPDMPVRQQPLWDEHAAYIDQLYEAGKIVMAGPFSDNSGALLVIRAASLPEARTFFDDDPWLINHILEYGEVRPWEIFLNAFQPDSRS